MIRHLFVYGTLRFGFCGAMADRLAREAYRMDPAWVPGRLYHIADYPGLVLEGEDRIQGDLIAMNDPSVTLAWIDDYEECSDRFPAPHEYRRVALMVEAPGGSVRAWTYLYALPVGDLPVVAGGDFLACTQGRNG